MIGSMIPIETVMKAGRDNQNRKNDMNKKQVNESYCRTASGEVKWIERGHHYEK